MRLNTVRPPRILLLFIGFWLSLAPLPTHTSTARSFDQTTHPSSYAMDFVTSIGGAITKIAVDGNYAYLGEGYTFTVLDLSNALQPQQVANVLLPEPARDVDVQDGFAFVVLPHKGLRIFDVRNPYVPTWMADYTQVGGSQLQIAGSLAYFTVTEVGLQLLDIGDPAHPRRLNTYAESSILGSWVTGSFAYIINGAELQVIEVSNPAHLVLRGSISIQYPMYAEAIHVIGSTAYVNLAYKVYCGVAIFDLSDPAQPKSQSGPFPGGCINDMQAAGQVAYVTATPNSLDDGLRILDVHDPLRPTAMTSIPAYQVADVIVVGKLVYLANPQGLLIMDVSDAAHPLVRAPYGIPEFIPDFQIIGQRAYLGSSATNYPDSEAPNGFLIVNFGIVNRPALEGSFATIGWPRFVDVIEGRAYITDAGTYPQWLGDVKILDVSQPLSPTLLGTFAMPGDPPRAAQVVGDLAYILSESGNLNIVDVSHPSTPTVRSSTPISQTTTTDSIEVLGNYAYIGGGSSLQVIDISNPLAPRWRGSFALPGLGTPRVRIDNTTAYIANENGGMYILDLSDPTHPTLLSRYVVGSVSDGVKDLDIVNNLAYLAIGSGGVQIVDVSNPAQPTLRGYYKTPWYATRLQVANNLVYVSSSVEGSGLTVFRTIELQVQMFLPQIQK